MTSFRTKLTLLFGTVLLVFGLVADHRARDELRQALGAKLEKRGVAIARDLATLAADAISTGDDFALARILQRMQANNPDTRYLLVIEGDRRILASTFGAMVPRDLVAANRVAPSQPWQLRRFATDEGIVRDIAVPIPELGGTVRVGMSDRSLAEALSGYSATLSLTLAVILVVGVIISYGLAGILTRPLQDLIAAVRSVARGNLRETIASPGHDEIGELAVEFNSMTHALEEKEATRQALVEKVITIQEEERRRVARDLHDDLSQSLAYVLMRLEELAARLGTIDDRSRAVLGDARDVLDSSLIQMRRLIGDLRPTILDDLGLVAALRSHAESRLRPTGCRVDFDAGAVRDQVPPVVEIAVFRIVQEAINNIARHAGARSAQISLGTSAGSVTGRVVDDGCGFSSGRGPRTPLAGLGVQGMRERAALLGGSLTIREAAEGGTVVSFEVPLGTRRAG